MRGKRALRFFSIRLFLRRHVPAKSQRRTLHSFHRANASHFTAYIVTVTKTDPAPVPSDKSAIQSVTPSQIYAWEGLGPDVELTATSERLPAEQKWDALTGRVVDAKVEADGDIHLALQEC